jgi:deoxyribodipyrimidine photo-lyase
VTAILWFTRDLRAHDHPALRAAVDSCSSVVPVFCLDDRLLAGRHASGPRTQFVLECLAELRERMDGQLVIRRGAPERELAELARSAGATELHFSADSGPFARRRIERVKAAVGSSASSIRACTRSTTSTSCGRAPASTTPCSPRFTANGSGRRAGT